MLPMMSMMLAGVEVMRDPAELSIPSHATDEEMDMSE